MTIKGPELKRELTKPSWMQMVSGKVEDLCRYRETRLVVYLCVSVKLRSEAQQSVSRLELSLSHNSYIRFHIFIALDAFGPRYSQARQSACIL